MIVPFSPARGQTVNIAVAATSSNVQATATTGLQQIRVMNNGTATAWIAFGTDNTIAATLTASVPVGSGGTEVFSVPGPVWIAAIAAGATGSVYFTPGEGI